VEGTDRTGAYGAVMHTRHAGWDPRTVDGLVVVLVGAAGTLGLTAPLLLGVRPSVPSALSLLLVLMQAGVLWWRRRRPQLVFVITLVAVLLAQAFGDINAASFLGPHAAAYALAAYTDRTRALTGIGIVIVTAALNGAVVTWLADDLPYGPVLLGPSGVGVLFAWGVGRYVQVRRAYLEAVLAYTRQLEQDRDAHLQRAIREERRRIARDLHDQVAHQLGVISLQTSAARRWLGRDQERAASALASAEQASRTALETMPTILQALRSDEGDAGREPQPTLADVGGLLDQMRDAGITIDLEVQGEPHDLHPTVELTAYRVIQESLTNVVKHAGPAQVTVRLHYGHGRFEIDVEDDGHGPAASTGTGQGLGLVGMRERVQLLDGELVTGPRDGGGFRVHASLPATAAADRP
jgi:signal transduction histidine kinase